MGHAGLVCLRMVRYMVSEVFVTAYVERMGHSWLYYLSALERGDGRRIN